MATSDHSTVQEGCTHFNPLSGKLILLLRRIARKLYDYHWYRISLVCYNRLVKLEPDNDNTWHDRGIILSKLGQHDKAIADYKAAIKIYPNHDRAYFNIGIDFADQAKHAEAIQNIRKAIELNAKRGLYWYGLAISQNELRDKAAALNSAKKAIALGADESCINVEDFHNLHAKLEKEHYTSHG